MDKLNNNKGFTLIESVIATAVLGIGILALQTMQITSIKGNAHANRITTSSILASDRLERIYTAPYRDTTLTCADDLMCDRDGDGTDQDIDMNGIDEVTADDSDTNFGLDDDTALTADHVITADNIDDIHTIFINIATDHPVRNNKTIRVIVLSNQMGNTRRVEYTYIKDDLI